MCQIFLAPVQEHEPEAEQFFRPIMVLWVDPNGALLNQTTFGAHNGDGQ